MVPAHGGMQFLRRKNVAKWVEALYCKHFIYYLAEILFLLNDTKLFIWADLQSGSAFTKHNHVSVASETGTIKTTLQVDSPAI